jgi:mRNA interferase MazF
MPVRRGDVYWIDWDPARGSEQAGRRPGLVVSNDIANQHAPVVIVASMTTRQPSRPFPFLVQVTAAESGLPRDCTINCLKLMTVAKDRLITAPGQSEPHPAGRLSPARMADVERALKAALALP